MELIENIPFGLAACFLNGEQFTVTAISDTAVCVRLDREVQVHALVLYLYRRDEAKWIKVEPKQRIITSCEKERYGFRLTIAVDDAEYRQAVRRTLSEYAEFIRLKSEDEEWAAHELTGCPYAETEEETLSAQKKHRFSGIGSFSVPENIELALSLDNDAAYRRFLQLPIDVFAEDFFKRSFLPVFGKAQRLYIGSRCCPELFPDNVRELTDKCRREGLYCTIVLPPIRENRSAWLEKVLAQIPEDCEIEVNDLGTLLRLSGCKNELLLGVQMNRRRKDPRMKYTAFDTGAFSGNSLNDDAYREMLKRMGICRFEYESCGYPVKLPKEKCSLHLPYYLTNTSHACPLASYCEGTDPGLPRQNDSCKKACLHRAMLYPEGLGITGRYNALFGLDRDILTEKAALDAWLRQGVDRLVMELL